METYETIEDGGWTELPARGMYLACCDCLLVHEIKPTRRGGKLGLLVRRDERKTAALRRTPSGNKRAIKRTKGS